jgi:hypothetical protein
MGILHATEIKILAFILICLFYENIIICSLLQL